MTKPSVAAVRMSHVAVVEAQVQLTTLKTKKLLLLYTDVAETALPLKPKSAGAAAADAEVDAAVLRLLLRMRK